MNCLPFLCGTIIIQKSRNLLYDDQNRRFQNRVISGNLGKIARFDIRAKPKIMLIEFVLSEDLLYPNYHVYPDILKCFLRPCCYMSTEGKICLSTKCLTMLPWLFSTQMKLEAPYSCLPIKRAGSNKRAGWNFLEISLNEQGGFFLKLH